MGNFKFLSNYHRFLFFHFFVDNIIGPVVTEAARSSLQMRYSLLPLLYTELFKASQDGRPVARALNFVFPNDMNTYDIKNQFLWADKLMIVPVIERGVR